MRETLRPPLQALLACIAAAVAEIAWTYGTGFVTAAEALWIVLFWCLTGLFLGLSGHVLPAPPASSARLRLYLLAPSVLLGLRGVRGPSAGLALLVGAIVLLGLGGLIVLATRRPMSLGRMWLLALFCAAASTSRAVFFSIDRLALDSVMSVHTARVISVGGLTILALGLAIFAWRGRWNGSTFVWFCLAPTVVLTAAFVGGVAVRGPQSPQTVAGAPGRQTVVIVVLDTLRRDGLSAFGGPPGQTPNLDHLAARSTVYPNAYSNGTYSLPGHGSLLSGLLPGDHGAHRLDLPVRPSVPLLAEELRGLGYRPEGYSANMIYLAPWTGLQRGFGHFYSEGRDRFGYRPASLALLQMAGLRSVDTSWWPAEDFVRAVEPIVATQGSALFLNLMECHAPRPDFEGLDERTAYQETVKKLDRTLAGFLRKLETLPNAVVVITSDHGEFLGEHGLQGHGAGSLYEPGIRIPLMIRFPGQTEGRVDKRLVSLMDVSAIVRAAIAGTREPSDIPLPKEPRVITESWAPRPVRASGLGEGDVARAIYLGHHKLIEHLTGAVEVFDLDADPGETGDLAIKDPEFARAMISFVRRSVPPMKRASERHPSADIPPEVLDRMRALGYIK